MLAITRNCTQRVVGALIIGAIATTLASCASKQPPPLLSEGSRQDSALPWNEQQKWESQGQFAPMAERQGGGENNRIH